MATRATSRRQAASPVQAAPTASVDSPATGAHEQALAAALRQLDAVLAAAVDQQARRLGPQSLLDPWLGMHLEADQVRRLLAGQGAASTNAGVCGLLATALRDVPAVAPVAQAFELQDIDLAVLLIALAPELDLRYERLYGYLQDDLTRRRPSLDLVANLLATDAAQRLAVCARFSRQAPLRRHAVLATAEEERPATAQAWQVDRIWRTWLLQGDLADALDEPLAPRDPPVSLQALALEPAARLLLEQAIALAGRLPLRLCLHGEHGVGKFETAGALAARLRRQLVALDVRALASPREVRETLDRAGRAACLFAGLLYVHGTGPLEQRDPQLLRTLLDTLDTLPCHLVVACVRPPAAQGRLLPWLRVELGYPSARARRQLWQAAASAVGTAIADDDAALLASRFSLGRVQIAQAAAEAQLLALAQHRDQLRYPELAAAVRRQCGGDLARLATRVAPRADFDCLVAPADVQAQLREICARVATRELVAGEWSGDSVHARAAGITALFVGPSGTGKTLSAEAVARELGLDLFRIDLAAIVSKYIGETEKNLDRVFAAAAHANAVLFFDEADALFGKRSEVKDAHDRYANIEVAYLLQKMERFDGLAILASNLKQNIDEAFARRLTFTVNFPFPEEPERRRLWEALWPPRAPRADDVDLAWFAREFRLSGGNIRNTVLAAAHLAAADGRIVTRAHLLHATRREFQKLGKNLATAEPAAAPRRSMTP